MAKVFVPCAIDHGTTNSSIAVMEAGGPRVIKPDGVNDVMPSAVYYSHRGRKLIGHAAAKAMLIDPGGGVGHTGYKTRMGHDDRYAFPGGRVLTVPQMGAEILGTLLQAYRDEGSPDYKAAVITVPAKFEYAACEATLEAARLAGLVFTRTLMEPVAAALAYGFGVQEKNAKWMIFDLGGGTLDVCLLLINKGRCDVLPEGNAGDPHLGGRKFDRELMDFLLGPRRKHSQYQIDMDKYKSYDPDYCPLRAQYALEDFSEETHKAEWGALLMAVETAKIALSEEAETVIACPAPFEDSDGKVVKVEFPISRKTYERLIASDAERAVQTCQDLLRRNRLKPSEIQRIILIGGPSKTPYIQQVLHDRLQIPLAADIDPMTAVALGAAIFANTVEIPAEVVRQAGIEMPVEDVDFGLEYESYSSEPICSVTGMIRDTDRDLDGWTVEINRIDGLWSSGRQPLDVSGLFEMDVTLIQDAGPTLSQFETRILDRDGRVVVKRNEPKIWFPQPGVILPLPMDLMIGLFGNDTRLLLKQGIRLPATSEQQEFFTTGPLRAGQEDDVLIIPVLEGVEHFLGEVDPHADANVKVGELLVRGTDVSENVPQGAPVQVMLQRDENRHCTVRASIELTSDEFEATFEAHCDDPPAETMAESFDGQRRRLEAVRKLNEEYPLPAVTEGLERLQRQDVIHQIEQNLERTREGDRECRSRCHRDILRLSGTLYCLHERQTEARLRRLIKMLDGKLEGSEAEQLRRVENELQPALDADDKKALRTIETTLDQLYYAVRLRPFIELLDDLSRFPDQFRGTQAQGGAYHHACKVAGELIDKDNRGEELTDEDLDNARRAKDELWRHWGKEFIEWLPQGGSKRVPGQGQRIELKQD